MHFKTVFGKYHSLFCSVGNVQEKILSCVRERSVPCLPHSDTCVILGLINHKTEHRLNNNGLRPIYFQRSCHNQNVTLIYFYYTASQNKNFGLQKYFRKTISKTTQNPVVLCINYYYVPGFARPPKSS